MSLTEIEYGSLASSRVLNDNFNYLLSQINTVSGNLTAQSASVASQIATLNTSITNLLDYREAFIAVGMILPYLGSVVPDGYLLCDGSELNVSDFEDLYEVIGTTYGSTDSTKFNLPDLRDKTLWGIGENTLGTEIESGLPNIKGQFRLYGTEGSSAVSGAFSAGTKGGSYGKGHSASASNPLMQFDASTYNSIYSDECSIVQPPALAVQFIVKY